MSACGAQIELHSSCWKPWAPGGLDLSEARERVDVLQEQLSQLACNHDELQHLLATSEAEVSTPGAVWRPLQTQQQDGLMLLDRRHIMNVVTSCIRICFMAPGRAVDIAIDS